MKANKSYSNEQLQAEARKLGREHEYLEIRGKILEIMNNAVAESQEDYAAFLFAFSSIANDVQRSKNKPKQH